MLTNFINKHCNTAILFVVLSISVFVFVLNNALETDILKSILSRCSGEYSLNASVLQLDIWRGMIATRDNKSFLVKL